MTIIDEKNFIDELRAKNPLAMEYIVENYILGNQKRGIIFLYNKRDYMDDLIQETLLGVWQYADSFNESRSSFKNWIAGIARFKAIDILRATVRISKEVDLDNLGNSEVSKDENIVDDFIKEEIDKVLKEVDEVNREILRRYYLKDEDIKFISEKTGLSIKAIYHRISRTRDKLKESRILREVFNGKNI